MECYVCCSDIKKLQEIKCSSLLCTNYICAPCVVQYFTLCLEENQNPLCAIPCCNHYYDIKTISPLLSKKQLRLYKKAVVNYYDKRESDNIDRQINNVVLLDRIMNERKKFIEENFPAAIYKMATITLPKEIVNVKRSKELLAKKSYKVPCHIMRCKGYLGEKNECNLCGATFCDKCDQKVSSDVYIIHTCKPEDIATLEELNKLIKCPGCKSPVIKSEGCNYITCARCGIGFDYRSGKKDTSEHTATNVQYTEKKTDNSFLHSVKDLIDKSSKPIKITRLIGEIEDCRPKTPSFNKINTLLIEMRNEKEKENIVQKRDAIVKAAQQYQKKCIMHKQYQRYLNEIEVALREGTLKTRFLENILSYYQ